MTMKRDRMLQTGGGVTFVDVFWDSPLRVWDEDGNIISEGDPNATYLIHEIIYQNMVDPPADWLVKVVVSGQPMQRLVPAFTPETTWALAPGQRPDMRNVTSIAWIQQTRTGLAQNTNPKK